MCDISTLQPDPIATSNPPGSCLAVGRQLPGYHPDNLSLSFLPLHSLLVHVPLGVAIASSNHDSHHSLDPPSIA